MWDAITVKSQGELSQIPAEFAGMINIRFGSFCVPARVNESHPYAEIVAQENSIVVLLGSSTVTAYDNSTIIARDNSTVVAWDKANVVAWDKANVVAWENSNVVAHENTIVTARGNSTVTAWDHSTVIAWENASVTAWGNSQVCDITENHEISVNGNARIIHMPQNGVEYCNFYDLPTHDGVGVFYKAVRKKFDGTLYSDYDYRFKYEVGKVATAELFDNDPTCTCSHGIHMACLDWAYHFGSGWDNLVIIEVEAKLDDIVVPIAAGKVRAPSVKVIREVPAEEYEKLLGLRR